MSKSENSSINFSNQGATPPQQQCPTASQKRGPWSADEDRRLMELISLYGPSNWVRISTFLGTRTAKQCRERYHQNLKPSLNRSPITPEEGALIEELVNRYGKRWAEIARQLNGRSDNAIKNWWNGGASRRRRASCHASENENLLSSDPSESLLSTDTQNKSLLTNSQQPHPQTQQQPYQQQQVSNHSVSSLSSLYTNSHISSNQTTLSSLAPQQIAYHSHMQYSQNSSLPSFQQQQQPQQQYAYPSTAIHHHHNSKITQQSHAPLNHPTISHGNHASSISSSAGLSGAYATSQQNILNSSNSTHPQQNMSPVVFSTPDGASFFDVPQSSSNPSSAGTTNSNTSTNTTVLSVDHITKKRILDSPVNNAANFGGRRHSAATIFNSTVLSPSPASSTFKDDSRHSSISVETASSSYEHTSSSRRSSIFNDFGNSAVLTPNNLNPKKRHSTTLSLSQARNINNITSEDQPYSSYYALPPISTTSNSNSNGNPSAHSNKSLTLPPLSSQTFFKGNNGTSNVNGDHATTNGSTNLGNHHHSSQIFKPNFSFSKVVPAKDDDSRKDPTSGFKKNGPTSFATYGGPNSSLKKNNSSSRLSGASITNSSLTGSVSTNNSVTTANTSNSDNFSNKVEYTKGDVTDQNFEDGNNDEKKKRLAISNLLT